jgi:hypothetical protein
MDAFRFKIDHRELIIPATCVGVYRNPVMVVAESSNKMVSTCPQGFRSWYLLCTLQRLVCICW